MTSDADLVQQGKQTHDLRHCDDPTCCTGVLMGRCRRCGFVVTVGTECPSNVDACCMHGHEVSTCRQCESKCREYGSCRCDRG
jgi:hypothetical protein